MEASQITLVECPRDAMQGWEHFIPTSKKIEYLNQLLHVGFDVLDFGSFVSPKAIPQLADTAEVLSQLDLSETKTKLLAIVANMKGAQAAVSFSQIDFLGYPFSISSSFQMRNTNATMEQSWDNVLQMRDLCSQHNRKLVVYLSMGFGNPYGDDWSPQMVLEWTKKMDEAGIAVISLADTVGMAKVNDIGAIFNSLQNEKINAEYGIHLHTTPYNWQEKVDAAFNNGCKRFDAALKGYGGCPFAEDDLVGNLATENLMMYLEEKKINLNIDKNQFAKALDLATFTFN
nr:hydroxymethylglutaryl-CoA lyase [Bacteroidota bacterium]